MRRVYLHEHMKKVKILKKFFSGQRWVNLASNLLLRIVYTMALLNVCFYCSDWQLTVHNCMAVSPSPDQLISHITLVVTSSGFFLYQHPITHPYALLPISSKYCI